MELNIFAKEVNTGKTSFVRYLTRLKNKNTGEEKSVTVKFRQSAGQPDFDECPCVVSVPRAAANLAERPIVDPNTGEYMVNDTGELKISRTLWVTEWEMVGPYIDHSLDDYE